MGTQHKTPAKIGIDIRTIHQGGGCATYLQHLIPQIRAQYPEAKLHLFTNTASTEGLKTIASLPDIRMHRITLPKALLLLYDWICVPVVAWRSGIDLFHGPKSATSLLYRLFGIPTVTTIHDIIPLTHPETEKRLNRWYWSVQIPLAYRCSTAVITISQYAQKQLEERYGRRSNLTMIYHGADHAAVDLSSVAHLWPEVQKQYQLQKPYILYFGTVQPRKRVLELITAYWNDPELRERYDCVIGGQWGWLSENVKTFIVEHRAEEHIHCTGRVSDEVREALYVHASVFAYLSRDEGFGFPVLEAMSARVPVITSNQSCLPEIVGDAGLCINAESEDQIRAGIHRIVDSDQVADALRVAGEVRFAEFTWKKCAEETIAVYQKLLK